MRRNVRLRFGSYGAAIFAAACFSFLLLVFPAPASQKLRLAPKFIQGQSFRYRIAVHTVVSGNTTTPIVNPEGASLVKRSVNLEVRIDVLDASSAAAAASPLRARLRLTAGKSSSTSETDAYDPAAAALDAGYDQFEGRSFEFSVLSDGVLSGFAGLEDVQPRIPIEAALRTWISRIISADSFPGGGIAIGQRWTAEKPVVGAPLRGLMWRAESSYLRDEPCHATDTTLAGGRAAASVSSDSEASTPTAPDPLPDTCAVVLTRFAVVRHGGSHGDLTPDDYIHNGLRTSGTWTGSGETLDSISLSTGMLTVSTETVSQEMDYQVRSAQTGSTLHYKGKTSSQSQITLLPQSSAPAQSP